MHSKELNRRRMLQRTAAAAIGMASCSLGTRADVPSTNQLSSIELGAQRFEPMRPEEMEALRQRCKSTAADGRYEPYKVSLVYDNPETRQTHGFPVDPHQKEVKEMLESLAGRPGVDNQP